MEKKTQNAKGARPHNQNKQEKLAAKLRENLKRRKQQVRMRGLDPASGSRGEFTALDQQGQENQQGQETRDSRDSSTSDE